MVLREPEIDYDQLLTVLQRSHPEQKPCDFGEFLVGRFMQIFYEHEAFVAQYKKVDLDFIYIQPAKVFLVNVIGRHADLMALLYDFYSNSASPSLWEAVDNFIIEGFGIFKSRAGNEIFKGPEFVLPDDLWPLRRDLANI